jgi:D-sedoheptulose 7-phosphate isomerase
MMDKQNRFIKNYFSELETCIAQCDLQAFANASELINKVSKSSNKIIIAGNGGSAAIASHAAVDFTKAAGVRSICFNESSLLTCFSNDFGYEYWLENALSHYYDEGDLVILISSSGVSLNILNAAKHIKNNSGNLITFSGFDAENDLRKMGKVNFYVQSSHYNMVENTHQIWLLALIDFYINQKSK